MTFPLSIVLLCSAAFAQDSAILILGDDVAGSPRVDEHIASVAEQIVPAWDDVDVQVLVGAGYDLSDHADAATQSGTDWYRALSGSDAGSWDYVLVEDAAVVPGLSPSSSAFQDSVDASVQLGSLVEAGGAEMIFVMGPAGLHGDPSRPAEYPDYPTMQGKMLDGYLAYVNELEQAGQRAWLVPVGRVYQWIYDDIVASGEDPLADGSMFRDLYDASGTGPSELGGFVAALTTVVSLTGRDLEDLERPDDLDQSTWQQLWLKTTEAVRTNAEKIPYPWDTTWNEYFTGSDMEQPVLTLSDPVLRPLIRLREDYELDHDIHVGVVHDGVLGDGLLLSLVSSTLLLDGQLILGAGGCGELKVSAGLVVVDELILGQGADSSGAINIIDGLIQAGSVSVGGGDVSIGLDGGTFEPGAGTIAGLWHTEGTLRVVAPLHIQGSYTLPVGTSLELRIDDPGDTWLQVDDTLILQGAVTLEQDQGLAPHQNPALVAEATSIEFDPEQLEVPAGHQLVVSAGGAGQQLLLFSGDVPNDTGADDTGAADTGDPDGGNDDDGCGCSAPASAPTGRWPMVLVVGLLGLAVRRR